MSANQSISGSQVCYLNQNWLDNTSGANAMSATLTTFPTGDYWPSNYWVQPIYQWPTTTYYTSPKIRLTLSEVEHMRECAAKDKKLRAALQKIAPYVEVEVDF